MKQYFILGIILISILIIIFFAVQKIETKRVGSISLKWIESNCGVVQYDTPSKKLELGYYYNQPDGNILVNERNQLETHLQSYLGKRLEPKSITSSSTMETPNPIQLKQTFRIEDGCYDVFIDADGKRYEEPITIQQYNDLNKPRDEARKPSKSIIQ
mgnify:FL=1